MINPQPVTDRQSPYSASAQKQSAQAPKQSSIPMTVQPNTEPKPPRKKAWGKYVFGVFITLIFAAGTFLFLTYENIRDSVSIAHEGNSSNVLKYNLNSASKIDPSLFKQPGDGRITLVLAGIGGSTHPGGNLTDSIQVISFDTFNNKMTTTSIPRDLYVTVPNRGKAKINAVYTYAEQQKAGSGATALRDVVEDVLGVPVTNFAMIDFSGIKDIVDALGGIDVDVPKAIYDPYYPADDMVHYSPFKIAAGTQHMDGALALKYSRSRETTSDFDRSARQQLVMGAIKKKALSAGVLTNPVKVLNLISALGSHFKTDMTTSEMKELVGIYQKISSDNSSTFVLDTSSKLGLLTAKSDPTAGYISYPVLGVEKYDAVHQWYAANNPDPVLSKETPTITVVNSGKATDKQVDAVAKKLESYGYKVTVSTTSLTNSKVTSTQLYGKDPDSKGVSRNYLAYLFGVEVKKGTIQDSGTDFEIVVVASTATASPTSSATASPKASSTP